MWRLVLLVAVLTAAISGPVRAADALTADVKSLTLDGARLALAAAEMEARRRGLRLSIAVVDVAGNLLAFERLGNAMPVSVDAALGKARTAALLGIPSKALEDIVDGGKPSYLAIGGVTPLQGGVPLMVKGVVVGGIASSGATAVEDEAVALAGASALASKSSQ
ncbi:MAG: heme-binding protein [Gammaproteobacteria bacterium]|nr:heme-binding protein [Gammaproteobacteria bacterium]